MCIYVTSNYFGGQSEIGKQVGIGIINRIRCYPLPRSKHIFVLCDCHRVTYPCVSLVKRSVLSAVSILSLRAVTAGPQSVGGVLMTSHIYIYTHIYKISSFSEHCNVFWVF